MSFFHDFMRKLENSRLASAEKTTFRLRIKHELQDARWESISGLSHTANIPELTNDEMDAVKNVWKRYADAIHLKSLDWNGHRLFKAFGSFDPRNVTRDFMQPWIIRSLNPAKYVHTLSNKIADFLYFYNLPRPASRLLKFGDCYYDGEMNVVSDLSAASILTHLDSFIVKPLFFYGGTGVQKVDMTKKSQEEQKETALRILHDYPDFIIQDLIHQHPFMSKFNESSVNTVRMNTLFLNGKANICTVCMRCGKAGAPVDNLFGGGMLFGLDRNGRFTGKAIDKKFVLSDHTPKGEKLSGLQIPNFERLASLATTMHVKLFPMLHLAGWDLALDENGYPQVVEINFRRPITLEPQLILGSFFNDRTDEVIDYALAHPFTSFKDELPR